MPPPINNPNSSEPSPKIKLNKAYKIDKNLFWEYKFTISKVKVEKVVKPPQKPTVKNNFNSWDIFSKEEKIANKIPINKQPITLATNVWTGNWVIWEKGRITLKKYLTTLPSPPPIKIAKTVWILTLLSTI